MMIRLPTVFSKYQAEPWADGAALEQRGPSRLTRPSPAWESSSDMPGRSHRLLARGKVWLEAGERFVMGDGGIHLLAAIDQTGSVRGASGRVGWSYRHALAYLRNAERRLGRQLVVRTRGGNDRGGARLTEAGRDLTDRYELLRQRLDVAVDQMYRSIFAGWS